MEIFGGPRTRVMGIVNVTPDSFSDGGAWDTPTKAIAHARRLVARGADVIDIGGESTRPGAKILSWEEEWARIKTVVETLAPEIPISVDTYHAQTAARAARAGAAIINDVTGGQGDSEMFGVVAQAAQEYGTAYILQHGRGNAQEMNARANYTNIAAEVKAEVCARLELAIAAGIPAEKIILDPGFGFAKTGRQDWQLAAHIEPFLSLGYPVLIGVSRKRFLAATETRPGNTRLGDTRPGDTRTGDTLPSDSSQGAAHQGDAAPAGGDAAPAGASEVAGASGVANTSEVAGANAVETMDGATLSAHPRDAATAALTQYFAEKGVWAVRVHDVAPSRVATEVVANLAAEGAYPQMPGTREAYGASSSGARLVQSPQSPESSQRPRSSQSAESGGGR
ncbi:dihydropteroate synthase [Actinobaculum suis]|uniref:dihydropteroate synthase n=1 Tax=Actinobaculum suis TaxID=1657 RepID=A0A1B9BD55_9ACTO|nr:dihydropteroate synthase [Actinobaculum suis]MDY5152922.1 dihydropteroate synthase [Actinobaculum suis]OCA94578.1 dihydropteroate synthase [Actinobaculum suis]OCA94989.1 dihydropteroate synthase [Actinobaculum suis]SDE35680.1 dihydropteroate synthase [Actinobaculum suis]